MCDLWKIFLRFALLHIVVIQILVFLQFTVLYPQPRQEIHPSRSWPEHDPRLGMTLSNHHKNSLTSQHWCVETGKGLSLKGRRAVRIWHITPCLWVMSTTIEALHPKLQLAFLCGCSGHVVDLGKVKRTGVGVTKAPFVNFSTSEIFDLAKEHLKLFESHWYLTGATAAELRRHLPNINLIFNSQHVFWHCWKIRKITERRKLA